MAWCTDCNREIEAEDDLRAENEQLRAALFNVHNRDGECFCEDCEVKRGWLAR